MPMLLFTGQLLANDNEAEIKGTVEDRYKEWTDAANKKDIAAMMNLCDENVILLPKAEDPALGRAAVGQYYKKLFANPAYLPFTLAVDWNSFHLVGDIAIATAVFDGSVTKDGKPIRFRGKTMLVWKKQTDGSWKIFRYMYDEIPPRK
jgi:ketosteroid isomerase-like protein